MHKPSTRELNKVIWSSPSCQYSVNVHLLSIVMSFHWQARLASTSRRKLLSISLILRGFSPTYALVPCYSHSASKWVGSPCLEFSGLLGLLFPDQHESRHTWKHRLGHSDIRSNPFFTVRVSRSLVHSLLLSHHRCL